MWEITLKGKPSDIVYFLDLKNKLKQMYDKNVLICITFEKDLVVSIAYVGQNKLKNIQSIIWQYIIKIVKVEYLQERLNCFTKDVSLNSFLLSNLIMLDIIDEVEYAMQIIRLPKVISIRSFIYFRLHQFIDLWQKEVNYYNNHFSASSDENYLNFLKFLASNTKSKSDIIYLESKDKDMLLLDKKRKEVKSFNKNDDVGLIASLIMFAPKKLIITGIENLSQKVSNLLSFIFEDRVSVLL